MLTVKNYGKTFNLSEFEPFRDQPVISTLACTGVLVKDDVIATAAHFAYQKNVEKLRFVFDFRMIAPFTPVTQINSSDIYSGVEIINKSYDRNGSGADFALVKLDRKVKKPVVTLFGNDVVKGQNVYALGYPCGLPLKFAPESVVAQVEEAYFSVGLDIYSGNSGSPVFDAGTHHLVGLVSHGHRNDFIWTGKGWTSIIHSADSRNANPVHCTKVSKFIDIL